MDNNDMEMQNYSFGGMCGGVHKVLDFIIWEGSKSFSCSALLLVECNCDKLRRLCVAHVIFINDLRALSLAKPIS
jgi:hypothetical protein